MTTDDDSENNAPPDPNAHFPPALRAALTAKMTILDGLVELNRRYFVAHPEIDARLETILYDRTGNAQTGLTLNDAQTVLLQNRANAEEAVAFRCAQLRAQGEDARPQYHVEPRPNGAIVIVPQVKRADGTIEMPWETMRAIALQ